MKPTMIRKKKSNVVIVARSCGNRRRVFRKLIIGLPIKVRINDITK